MLAGVRNMMSERDIETMDDSANFQSSIDSARDTSATGINALGNAVGNAVSFALQNTSLATPVEPLSQQELSDLSQISQQYGAEWYNLNDATARQVLAHATKRADGTFDLSRVIGGTTGLVTGETPVEATSFMVTIDSETGTYYRWVESYLGGDNGWGMSPVAFVPNSMGTIETRQSYGGEGEYYNTLYWVPTAQTLANEAARTSNLAEINSRGIMQVVPNSAKGNSLGWAQDGNFRSVGSMMWDEKYGLIANLNNSPTVAPRYLNATQVDKFNRLVSQYAATPGSSWEQLTPDTLQKMLNASTVRADGTLDLGTTFGGKTGYINLEPDPMAKSFEVRQDYETGQYFYYVSAGYSGDNGETYNAVWLNDLKGGKIVTDTVDMGGEIGFVTRHTYVPDAAYAAKAEVNDKIAAQMNAAGAVQVRPNSNGRYLSINDNGGYIDPSKFVWNEALGLITHNSNIYVPPDDGGWFDDFMDFIGDVLPIIVIVAIVVFAPEALGAVGEIGAAEVAAGEVVAGEVVAGEVVASEVVASEVIVSEAVTTELAAAELTAAEIGVGEAAAEVSANSIWSTQIGNTTLGNLANTAARNTLINLAMNGGDIDQALISGVTGFAAGAAGAYASAAAAAADMGTAAQNVIGMGTRAVVSGALTGNMDSSLANFVGNYAGQLAGDWAAANVAEAILNGSEIPVGTVGLVRDLTSGAVRGAVNGDVEAGITGAATSWLSDTIVSNASEAIGNATREDGAEPNSPTSQQGAFDFIAPILVGAALNGENGVKSAVANIFGTSVANAIVSVSSDKGNSTNNSRNETNNQNTQVATQYAHENIEFTSDYVSDYGLYQAGYFETPSEADVALAEWALVDYLVDNGVYGQDDAELISFGEFDYLMDTALADAGGDGTVQQVVITGQRGYTMETVLKDRGIPVAGSGNDVSFFSLDDKGQLITREGDEIINRRAYIDSTGKEVIVDANASGKFDIPQGVKSVAVTELWRDGKPLGRDYGTPQEWTDAVPGAIAEHGIASRLFGLGGDPMNSLRRQVSVNETLYPQLAAMIDKGSGQVNPLLWNKFLEEAKAAGVDMVVMTNGIDTGYQGGRDNASIIANNSMKLAINVYNPTSGMISDVGESSMAKANRMQNIHVAIASEISSGQTYQAQLAKDWNVSATSAPLTVIGHSQGSINAGEGIKLLTDSQRANLNAIYIGTAIASAPETRTIVNITDSKDFVVNSLGGRTMEQSSTFLTNIVRDENGVIVSGDLRPNRVSVATNITQNVTRPSDSINHHSLYLYAQDPKAREALGFIGYVMPTRPFVPEYRVPTKPVPAPGLDGVVGP